MVLPTRERLRGRVHHTCSQHSPSVNEKAFAPGGAGSVWSDDFRGEGGQLDVKSLRGLEQRLVRFDHDEGGGFDIGEAAAVVVFFGEE